MSDDNSDSAAALGFEEIEASATLRVVVSRAAKKVFCKIELQPRGRLARILTRWCSGKKMNGEMMKTNEGRTGKHKERLQAFKAWAVRLYGFERTVDGLRTFFIVDVDPAKKQDKGDPRILERAKRRADDVIDRLIEMEKGN